MFGSVKCIQWGKGLVKRIQIHPTLSSTNEFAKTRIKSGGVRTGTVIWALEQTQGRGRQGRRWDSDSQSLTFTLVWQCPGQVPPTLTLAVGLGLVQELEELVPSVQIKWPNDLWIAEKKLGGILTETVRQEGKLWVVLGIGLNVNSAPGQELSPRISLQEAAGCPWPRLGILHRALLGVERGFGLLKRGDFTQLFRRYGNFLDREITVFQGGSSFTARAREVLPDGRLLIEDARGVRAVLPDEIRLRF